MLRQTQSLTEHVRLGLVVAINHSITYYETQYFLFTGDLGRYALNCFWAYSVETKNYSELISKFCAKTAHKLQLSPSLMKLYGYS